MAKRLLLTIAAVAFATILGCGVSAAGPSADNPTPVGTVVHGSIWPVETPAASSTPTELPGPLATVAPQAETAEATETAEPVPVSTFPPPAPTATSPVAVVTVTSTSSSPTSEPSVNRPSVTQSMFGPVTCDPSISGVELTHSIYDPDNFDALVPMGRMWGSHVTPTDHLYVQLHEERERGYVRTPAAGKVVQVQRFPNDQAPHWDGTLVEPDIRVVIAHSCTLFSIFIHVGELAPEIKETTGEIERNQFWSPGPGQEISLEAGDPIALLGGSAFDYSMHDEATALAGFQVPSHYEGEPWKVHTVDPFDYMTEELAAELLARNERQVKPYGGQIDYDIRGTATGNWFMEGTVDYSGNGMFSNGEYWTGHLSIAYDHVEPSQIRISIGRDIGLTQDDCRICGGVYAVKGNGPDPADVTADSGIVRYEITGRRHSVAESRERTESDGVVLGTFLIQVLDDSSIRTEFFKGVSADGVDGFTDRSVVYRR